MTSQQIKARKRPRKATCNPPPKLPPPEQPADDSSAGATDNEAPTAQGISTEVPTAGGISTEEPIARGFSTDEFDEPFDLAGIRSDLRERMVAAAPLLLGREAWYEPEFFCTHVGLYGEGPLVKHVSKVYSFITDKEVTDVWRRGSQPNRYEFARCTDLTQRKQFQQQYYKVYGNQPDNGYYSLRFLKACYATFVYQLSVNWRAEAMSRLAHRLKNQHRNPRKLGPVATRCQIEGLCKIIKQLSCTNNEVGDSLLPASIPCLLAAQEEERICANEVEAAAAPLQETRLKLEAALKKMRAEDDEASVALNAAYMAASKETRRLLREGAPATEYVSKVAEMEDLASQIASEREADATIVAEVLQLESIAATQRATHDAAVAALIRAQEKVAEATQQSEV